MGFGPQMAMQLAERLYTQGFIRSCSNLFPIVKSYICCIWYIFYRKYSESKADIIILFVEFSLLENIKIRFVTENAAMS